MTKEKVLTGTVSAPRPKGVRGALLTFTKDPFVYDPAECFEYIGDGLIVITDGKIADMGDYVSTIARHKLLDDIEIYRDSVIMPGFVDCHVHYVQSSIIGSYGDKLLDWLNRYTFPTEMAFSDKNVADETARVFFRQILSRGTTTANVFATTFEESVDAFFEESERYNTLMISGKVLQDRNVPEGLRDRSPEESVAVTERLLQKWHGRGRQLYAVIPRFAPTSTPRQLRLAGELYQKYIDRGVYLHTHLDESVEEINLVAELFPYVKTYADVYHAFGMIDHRSVMAHCCVVTDYEWQLMHDHDCSVAHCPSSNLFLGGGQFRYWDAKKNGRAVRVGMGTDVGGGTGFSITRELGEAYKVAMLGSHSLDIVRSLYLATRGGAETLHLEDRIGSIALGYDADIAVIDLHPDSFAAWRLGYCTDIFEKLFALVTMSPDNLIRATYVAGQKVYDRDRETPFCYAAEIG
ncbi:MAG: guanine deaminase [Muribaculaceae bacterium]|nr:guanine deaminase [Muribaculaceae bacterium]